MELTIFISPMGITLLLISFLSLIALGWLILTHHLGKVANDFTNPRVQRKWRKLFMEKINEIDCNPNANFYVQEDMEQKYNKTRR